MAYNIPLRVRNLINKVGSTDPYDIADYLGIKIKPSTHHHMSTVFGNKY